MLSRLTQNYFLIMCEFPAINHFANHDCDVSRGPIDENLGSIIEGRIAKARVDGSGVVDLLLSWRSAKEVQWHTEESLAQSVVVGRGGCAKRRCLRGESHGETEVEG